MAVKMMTGDSNFTEACKKASEQVGKPVLPTRRQYKKWQRKMGSAYQYGRQPNSNGKG